jgi:hypothetical protein
VFLAVCDDTTLYRQIPDEERLAITVTIISNPADPVLVRGPSIGHGVLITDCKKGCDGFLPRAHFLDNKQQVERPLLQDVSVSTNEPNYKSGRALLGCIGEVICVRGSCHHQKGVSLLFSSRRNFKFQHAKKEAQEAFDD